VDGTDVYAVYKEVSEAVERARRGEGPSVIEARAYRITPHSSDDDDRTYRSREEVEENKKKDPLIVSRAVLEKKGYLDEAAYKQMDEKARKIVEDAVQAATAAPYPQAEEALHPVYAEEIELMKRSNDQQPAPAAQTEAAHG
jgi:2-oxoisovalerate dehydrogenase E1 component alpha subunit